MKQVDQSSLRGLVTTSRRNAVDGNVVTSSVVVMIRSRQMTFDAAAPSIASFASRSASLLNSRRTCSNCTSRICRVRSRASCQSGIRPACFTRYSPRICLISSRESDRTWSRSRPWLVAHEKRPDYPPRAHADNAHTVREVVDHPGLIVADGHDGNRFQAHRDRGHRNWLSTSTHIEDLEVSVWNIRHEQCISVG